MKQASTLPSRTLRVLAQAARIAFPAVFACGTAAAQFDVQLPLMYGLQQTYGNPAALQDHGLTIGLPSVAAGGYSPLNFGDLGPVRDGVVNIVPRDVYEQLGGRDLLLRGEGVVDAFSLTIRSKAWQVGVGHRARVTAEALATNELLELSFEGNAGAIGETIDLRPRARGMAYQQFYLQLGKQVNDKLTLGARFAYLDGSGFARLSGDRLSVHTDPDYYQLTFAGDLSLQTAGLDVQLSDGNGSIDIPERYTGAGKGFGIDLGATYRLAEKLQLGFAIRDLGIIRWSEQAVTHRFSETFTYTGANSLDREEDAIGGPFSGTTGFFDSAAITRERQDFTTATPASAQATAHYRLARYTTANATLFARQTLDGAQAGFGVGIGQRFWELGHLGVLAGVKAGGPFASFNLMVDLFGPQVYVAVDNVWLGEEFANVNDVYVRAGVNLAFGKKKKGEYLRGWYDKVPKRPKGGTVD